MVWTSGPVGVASVDPSTGLVEGVGPGTAGVGAVLEVVPGFFWLATPEPVVIEVRGPVAVEVTPADGVVLASQQWTVFDAVVRDSVSGEPVPVNDGDVMWEALDPGVADVSLGFGGDGIPIPNGRRVEGGRPGATEVRACAQLGLEPPCVSAPVTVVWNLNGTWRFDETLTTELELPQSETCDVSGTVTLVQNGAGYTGTSMERATCTFDPGDGTEPEVVTIETTGTITSGRVDGNRYSHETTLGGEGCRSSGVLSTALSEGAADFANGTTECLDDAGFYSVGPSRGEWIGGTRSARLDPGSN
jgi:hypothetical protein